MRRFSGSGLLGLIALQALFVMPVQGQRTVTFRGRVMDAETQTPIGAAYVFPADSRTGTLTDSLGRFLLEMDRADRYRIRVSQLGYEELELELGADAPEYFQLLVLSPDPLQLEGLTVLAERLEERRRGVYGTGEILDRRQLIRSPGNSGFDLVRRVLPFVEPCDPESEALCTGGIQKRRVRVCLDGHSVPSEVMETSLSGVDPRALYLVEAYTRVGEVRMYSPAYMKLLMQAGARLPPLTFGCDDAVGGGGG